MRSLGAGLGVLLTWGSAAARAERDGMLASPHTEHSAIILGAKGVATGEHESGRARAAGGAGAFAETTLLEDRLELEIGAVLTSTGDELALEVEPLLKLPLRVASFADLYLAAGATLAHTPGKRSLHAGPLGVVGSYFWFNDASGLDADLSLTLFPSAPTALAWSVGLGPVVRF